MTKRSEAKQKWLNNNLGKAMQSCVRAQTERLFYQYSMDAQFFIAKGADVNAQNEYCDAPLMMALRERLNILSLALVAAGANVNAQNEYGNTPLILAAEYSSGKHLKDIETRLCLLFIAKGADVNAQNERGNTALIWAIENSNTKLGLALVKAGANVNAKDNDDITPLMLTAVKDLRKLGVALLDKGANVHAQNHRGETALDLAVKSGNFDFVKMLHEHGVDISSVQDLILAHEEKVQAEIKEAELKIIQDAELKIQNAKLTSQTAIENHNKTPLSGLAADFRKAQTQRNEPKTVSSSVPTKLPTISLDKK